MKKIFFENWTSRGVNRGLTQFHTQFMHVCMFVENKKKKILENCFENVVSDLENNG